MESPQRPNSLEGVIAGNVRAEMARKMVAQKEMAAAIGMSSSAFSDLYNGTRPFRLATLDRIADVLGVDIAVIVRGDAARGAE